MLNVEQVKPILASGPANMNGTAMTEKYVSLKNYDHLTIKILTGAWAAGTAAVTVNEAKNVSAGSAQALAFTAMYSDEVTAGTLVKNTVAANTFNLDTANSLYVIEIDAAQLSVDDGFDCVSVEIASPGGNNDYYAVLYELSGARYGGLNAPSPLTD